jgi:hypothetical protein
MPQFFFHLYNDIVTIDQEGREFASVAAARGAAEQDAREMAAYSVRQGQLNLAHYIEVTDGSGEAVVRVTFAEAVSVIDQPDEMRTGDRINLDQ